MSETLGLQTAMDLALYVEFNSRYFETESTSSYTLNDMIDRLSRSIQILAKEVAEMKGVTLQDD